MREHRGVAADMLNIENALCNYLEKHHKGASKTISSKKLYYPAQIIDAANDLITLFDG